MFRNIMSNYSPVILSLQQEILTISAAKVYIYMDLAKFLTKKFTLKTKKKCIYTIKQAF